MNFLDEASTTNYSTRASAASACAADQGRFPEYAHALFEHQPPEGGPGLSDAELTAVGKEAGLAETFGNCVAEGPYLGWPSYVTERAAAAGVSGRRPSWSEARMSSPPGKRSPLPWPARPARGLDPMIMFLMSQVWWWRVICAVGWEAG